MNWFQQNRFLGTFLAGLALATLLAVFFLWHEKSAADEQEARLEAAVNDTTRLRQGRPFPNAENLRKMNAQTDSYRNSLLALEKELTARTPAIVPMQPNEFQAELRQAASEVVEKARASKVRLPDNFFLGFDEYATSLPNSTAAPILGRELKAIEWLAKTVIDGHVDTLTGLSRARLAEEIATPAPLPGKPRPKTPAPPVAPAGVGTFHSLELTFSGTPAAARKVLNQIANADHQLFIVRTVLVRSQAGKGPVRGQSQGAVTLPPPMNPAEPASATNSAAKQTVSFIVGTEQIDMAVKIDIVNFNFPHQEGR